TESGGTAARAVFEAQSEPMAEKYPNRRDVRRPAGPLTPLYVNMAAFRPELQRRFARSLTAYPGCWATSCANIWSRLLMEPPITCRTLSVTTTHGDGCPR